MTRVRVSRYVDCPFSAAIELAEKRIGQRNTFWLTPALNVGERVRFKAACTGDCSDEARKHEALLIAWRPQRTGVFPEFRGVLTVRPKYHGVSLRLNGKYEPPYGAAGKLFDILLGRGIARRTMQRFIDDLATGIESDYQKERLQHQNVTTGETRVQAHPVPH